MSAPFILRPIATPLLIVGGRWLGLIGSRALPIAPLPSVDFPTIQVVTPSPGASATVVETSITAPLEHYFGTISGLMSMSSTSSYGNSQITLQFDLSRRIDSAAQDVQGKINAAAGWIPVGLVPRPPTHPPANPPHPPVPVPAPSPAPPPLHQTK